MAKYIDNVFIGARDIHSPDRQHDTSAPTLKNNCALISKEQHLQLRPHLHTHFHKFIKKRKGMELKCLSTCAYALKCFSAIGERKKTKNEPTGDLPATAVSCKRGKYYLSLALNGVPAGRYCRQFAHTTRRDAASHVTETWRAQEKKTNKQKKHKLLCEHNGPEHNSNTTDKAGCTYTYTHRQTLEMYVMLHLTKAKEIHQEVLEHLKKSLLMNCHETSLSSVTAKTAARFTSASL